MAARPLGPLRIGTIAGPPASVAPATAVAPVPSAADHLVVAVHRRGVASFVRNGEVLVCGPHDVVVFDASAPFTFQEADDFELHVVGLPHRLLGAAPDVLDHLGGLHPHGRGRTAALLGPLLADVAASASDLSARPAEHLAAGLVGLLGALATEAEAPRGKPGQGPGGRPDTVDGLPDTSADHHTLAARLRAHVNERLGDRDLTPGGIAAHHHISTRLLHKLFAADGITVSRWIQRRRLQECRRELAGARSGRPRPAVASVAKRWGFANAAHFSRSFRAAYGMSPTAWRDLYVPPASKPPRT
ncbi:helix-turn-helix domain-containing protein [Streptomyces mobaraensis]|uniref:helix-turn-helix domain-containing protein n=1 Tax=Streptomyces mobaraensis TaxID=35621 RepID=UPI0033346C8E